MLGVGLHLLIDGLSDKSLSRDTVQQFLLTMPGAIGMTPIDKLHIYRTTDGWAGIQLIAQSHCSVHTNHKDVHVDIFSCASFDTDAAINLSVQMLGLKQVRAQVLERGWLTPK